MVAANIMVALHDCGRKVALLDTEEGAPTAKALSAFDTDLTVRCCTQLEEIDDAISELKREFDVTVVDTPGKTGDAITTICRIADLIIVPIQTSRRDLRQVVPVIRRIQTVQRVTGGKPQAVIVLNFTRKRDIAARAFREQLEPLGIPIADTQLRRLDTYRDADVVMRDPQLNEEGAAADIRRLVLEIIEPHLIGQSRAGNE